MQWRCLRCYPLVSPTILFKHSFKFEEIRLSLNWPIVHLFLSLFFASVTRWRPLTEFRQRTIFSLVLVALLHDVCCRLHRQPHSLYDRHQGGFFITVVVKLILLAWRAPSFPSRESCEECSFSWWSMFHLIAATIFGDVTIKVNHESP